MTAQRFMAELIQGHKGVTAILVPFDPEQAWDKKPVKIDPRRDGWLIRGSLNGARFEGWIGYRWGRFFIILSAELRAAAGVAVGDKVHAVVSPTGSARALAVAREQAKLTTAPRSPSAKRARVIKKPALRKSGRKSPRDTPAP
jgi:hypothetical protein